MNKEEFLAWLMVTDREQLDLEGLRRVAGQVQVDEPDEEFAGALQSLLHEPDFRVSETFSWPQDFSDKAWVDDVGRIQHELQNLADTLEHAKWYTESMVELEEALAQNNEDLVDELEQRLLLSWETYSTMPVLESETTAETVVGHAFLKQGFGYWLDAIDCFRDGVDDADILWLAEQGNRYLVAVQQLVKLL